MNRPSEDSCIVSFNRATVRIVSEASSDTVLVEILPENKDDWIPCIRANSTAIEKETHSYIATSVAQPHMIAHYIHSIKFYDNEPEEVEQPEEMKNHQANPAPRNASGGPSTLWALYKEKFERF